MMKKEETVLFFAKYNLKVNVYVYMKRNLDVLLPVLPIYSRAGTDRQIVASQTVSVRLNYQQNLKGRR